METTILEDCALRAICDDPAHKTRDEILELLNKNIWTAGGLEKEKGTGRRKKHRKNGTVKLISIELQMRRKT